LDPDVADTRFGNLALADLESPPGSRICATFIRATAGFAAILSAAISRPRNVVAIVEKQLLAGRLNIARRPCPDQRSRLNARTRREQYAHYETDDVLAGLSFFGAPKKSTIVQRIRDDASRDCGCLLR
jgi:hypothetical protein